MHGIPVVDDVTSSKLEHDMLNTLRYQPDLTAIRTYFTRWLIHKNVYDLTRFVQNYTYVTRWQIHMNL